MRELHWMPSGLLLRLCLVTLVAGACERPDAVAEPGAGDGAMAAVESLASPAGEGSGEPFLSLAPDGRVLLSWQERVAADEPDHELRFSVLEEGSWSAPMTVARGDDWFVNWADFPSILMLPDGRLAAHFLQRHPNAARGYHYDVRIVQSADGGRTWSAPVTPHRDGVPAEHGFVSLWAAPGDSLGAVWLDGRKADERFGGTGEMTLRATTLGADGGLGEERVLDERICDCCQTALAVTSNGPVVAYRGRSHDEIRDILVTRLVDGEWTAGRVVHPDGWRIPGCPVNGPALSARGDRVAIAWFTAAGDTARVNVAFSDDAGATFGPPVRVDGGDPAGRVDVELLGGGGAMVTWLERTGVEDAEVRARQVTPAGDVADPVAIARSSGGRASGFPRMTHAGDRIIFAWTEAGDPSRVRTAQAQLRGER